MRSFLTPAFLLVLVCAFVRAQEKESEAMPKLEIPEITIIGKKPIILPFARKGELYDVPLYVAAEPDSSLLEGVPSYTLPLGVLPLARRVHSPFHAALAAGFGSFRTGHFEGFADYLAMEWSISGRLGYRTTQGHVANASASSLRYGVQGRTRVSTDNDFLGSLSVIGDVGVSHDDYGLFGVRSASIGRRKNHVVMDAEIGSVWNHLNRFDVHLRGNLWSLRDSYASADSQISGASPHLRATFGTPLHSLQLSSSVFYASSSLSGARTIQSPLLLGVSADVGWRAGNNLLIQIGGTYASGSHSSGGDQTLLLPSMVVEYALSPDQELSWWWKPEMRLTTYEDYFKQIPFLNREIELRAERIPVSVGTSFWMKSKLFDLEARLVYSEHHERSVQLADTAGRIRLAYVYARQFESELVAFLYPLTSARVRFSGTIQPAREGGSSTQLPMIPLINLNIRGEIDLSIPLVLSSSIEYISQRTIDLAGQHHLKPVLLFGVGASTHVVPRTSISLDVLNVFNSGYEFWKAYVAPGRQIRLEAKTNL